MYCRGAVGRHMVQRRCGKIINIMCRRGQPKELGGAAIVLASDASRYVPGANFVRFGDLPLRAWV
jgi:NAD(P)-dependent dehydrogenase (short-subunit alcohol dehydrogenase family)